MTGVVRRFDTKNGWGFITAADGREVFVHARAVCPDINGSQLLYPGDEVEFEVEETLRTPEAKYLHIVSPVAPAKQPVPREVGYVFFIHPEGRYARVSRQVCCSNAYILGNEVNRLGGLTFGQWLEFQPIPSKVRNLNYGRNPYWVASECVAIEAPLHAAELAAKCSR